MRRLGTVDVCRVQVRVLLCSVAEANGSLDAEDTAAFEHQDATIYVRRWEGKRLEPTDLWSKVEHEFWHADFWHSGAYLALKDALPKWTVAARDDLEERIITAIQPLIPLGGESCPTLEDVRSAIANSDALIALFDAAPWQTEDLVFRLARALHLGCVTSHKGMIACRKAGAR